MIYYIFKVNAAINRSQDYRNWKQHDNEYLFYCDYPFIFDTTMKAILLRAEIMHKRRVAIGIARQEL